MRKTARQTKKIDKQFYCKTGTCCFLRNHDLKSNKKIRKLKSTIRREINASKEIKIFLNELRNQLSNFHPAGTALTDFKSVLKLYINAEP